ncbi:putative cytochrome P450 [Trypanosoma cruzi]|nr:putative cytochrome P450 [Trypanosoma cruzi]
MDREPSDQLMGFGRALPQTFRTLIAITTDPSISRPPHFVPAFTWPFTRLTPSRGRPSLFWSGAQPNKNNDCCDVSCVVFMDTTHLHATCAAQSAIKKRRGAAGCLRGRKNTAPSNPPPPTNPRTRRRTVPLTLRLIF